MRFLSIALLTAFLLQAEAAEIVMNPPVALSASVGLVAEATNNDQGAVYDSMKYPLFTQLAQQLQGFGGNPSAYPDVAALIAAWTKSVSGEVANGWALSLADSKPTLGTRHIDGIPNITYDVMSTGRTQIAFVAIPNSQLELNATAGYQPFTLADVSSASWDASLYDAIIVRSDSPLLRAASHTGAATPGEIPEAFVGTFNVNNSWSASGLHYLLLTPGDFAEWTDFSTEHPSLDPAEDANGNGRSNFLDYAGGQDPEAAGLLPLVALEGNTLTLRRRTNGIDAIATAEYSDDLDEWFPLEEGVHHTLVSDTVSGTLRTLVLELLPGQPDQRFFRQKFQ